MAKTVHIDLSPYGREGEWVDVLDPRFLTPRQTREINSGDGEAILRHIVTAWRIADSAGATLAEPATDLLDDIENGLFAVIVEEFRALAGAPLPRASSRP